MKKHIGIIIVIVALIEVVAAFFIASKLSSLDLFHRSTDKEPSLTQTPLVTIQPTLSGKSDIPAEILDLTNWKITLPIGNVETPTEIKQPKFAQYQIDPWFVTAPNENAVRFRAPVNGVTTSGSGYPRCELREMINNGSEKASWSSTVGTHTMTIDQAITAVPKIKQHVVAGQIHDADDDIIVIRLESSHLYVNDNGKNVITLDNKYTLGKRFIIKFVVSGGKTDIFYNNNTKSSYTLSRNYSGAYFKAGVYTQSNCDKEKSTTLCSENNFGEVKIYQILVTHK